MGIRAPKRCTTMERRRNSAKSCKYSLRPAEILEARQLLTGVPIITEFLADNSNSILDGNGNSSDWVEIFNAGDAAVDLDGWYLTDDAENLTQWQFPSRNLEAGEFLLVFASGDGVPDAGGNLHTNFGLDKNGDYLALVEPDGVSVASAFQLNGVGFPDQVEDISYGIVQDATETVLISAGASVDVYVPGSEALGTTWTAVDFVPDASWLNGVTGVGYDTLGGATGLKLDFNDQTDGESGAANTEDGYEVMTLSNNGATFDGITVTLSPLGGASLDDRDRPTPVDNPPSFTLDQLYDDFIFANGTFDGAGMEVLIEGLTPNAEYEVTLRSYDVSSTGTRSSVWSEEAGGTSVVFANYEFNGSNPPETNEDSTIVASLTSSAQGTLRLRGVRQGGTSHGVFLNALELDVPGVGPLIGTDVEGQMFEQASSVFARIPFSVPVDASLDILTLDMQYDAGFVAYLNGQEVARRNVAGVGTPAFDDTATAERPDGQAVTPESINLTAFTNLLNVGPENVLAIHAINSDSGDSDLLVLPALSLTSVQAGAFRYFDPPTPAAANVGGFLGFVDDTQFSRDRGFYDAPFSVEITTNTPDAMIYYTTDGSVPAAMNPAAELYTSAVAVTGTTMLRAAAVRDGFRSSNVDTQTYIFLEDVLTQDPQADPNAPSYPMTWQANASGDYSMDPEVVAQWDDNNPDNDDFGIREALQSIPTMSIVMDHNDLWGPSGTGIYTDATQRIRKPGSIEYFDPQTGEQFQYNVGVQMHGNASRDNVRLKKHSFRLIFQPGVRRSRPAQFSALRQLGLRGHQYGRFEGVVHGCVCHTHANRPLFADGFDLHTRRLDA